MNRPWLLIDANFLCYKTFYSYGAGMEFEIGFMREVLHFMDKFNTEKVAFFFDLGKPKRREIFDGYKSVRIQRKKQQQKVIPKEEAEALKDFRMRVRAFRLHYLEKMGFRNVYSQVGYEADDLIASACLSLPKEEKAIIITADQDMYQCLRPNVSMYSPNSRVKTTVRSFKNKYGISPRKWKHVKAIAGCSSDSIPGIERVGEKTAIKYLRRELKETSKAYQSIGSDENNVLGRNIQIVALPFPGTMDVCLKPDKKKKKEWNNLIECLGWDYAITPSGMKVRL